MNGAQQVEARLRAIMQAWPLRIEPGCQHHLTRLIRDSARRVEIDGFAFDATKLADVDASFRLLLTEMTRQAGVLGLNELHEPTFIQPTILAAEYEETPVS